ncbi:MAG TPA: bifunctional diaminohydroxyphosphoribosylaminopyrimidine deaminase/5-amino-6-(5-phosphoribosylamino)uracil reductase, partial [Leptolyngbya sp.]|nr:bifunctional diaminohydroxyphosphoribosylaminopyrimidine deaminase/5-amino-6-(5-phosphoribosylamino)uracil reductase [Leptolyngbya sp.]
VEGCVQKVWAFVAPKIVGGRLAPTPIGDLGLERMTDAIPLTRVSWRAIESDLLIEGYLGGES